LPALTVARTKAARCESELAAMQIQLGLHLFKNKYGAFPDKIEQIAPEFLQSIPLDPVSGKAFEYKKDGVYFTISDDWLKEKLENYKKNSARTAGKTSK
jgi:hypothetical protein